MNQLEFEIEINKFANSIRRIGLIACVLGLFFLPLSYFLMPVLFDISLIIFSFMIYFGIVLLVIGDLLWRIILRNGEINKQYITELLILNC
ncbi:hypothetical protein [Bartonella sp. HY038]|uniref:hypothetical protein n=1 Tax=Bartonella sp. HY038 TaxID=2759660 RepID=UPI0015F7C927|nr:hypothetical protein [Bartonella sp. HY038]